MKVKLAKTAGFCMGVRRAMEIALAEVNQSEDRIFSFGPLIHNKQVMDLLESKGVTIIKDVSGLNQGTLLIRAHGIPPDQRKMLKSTGLRLVDATCPRVAKVQAIIRYHTKKGYIAVIVGDKDHPEVKGLVGYGNGRAKVIQGPEGVLNLPQADKICVVAQTTQDEQNYDETVEAIRKRFQDIVVFNTICDATHQRQSEVRSFANQVDGVIVVGGYHSGNTRRLVQVSEATGIPTFHIETEKELNPGELSSFKLIGVTAGASTPNWMIKNVVKEIESVRSRGETFLGRSIKRLFKALLLSNILVAIGAFSLTFSAMILSGRRPDFIHPTIALFYIYAMYVLNRFLDKGAGAYNDPERASFYRKKRIPLIVTALASITAALTLSYALGTAIFFAVLGLSILGAIYSIPILPVKRRERWRYSKIKDIPGSKTLAESLAWGALISLVPLLEPVATKWLPIIISF